jgi:effector-binding domain-containing protein
MTPFHEIKKVPAMKVAVWRGDVSMWGIDTAFSRLYDRAMEQKLLFRQPALGIRHGGVRIPEPFHADYEIMFPLTADPGRAVPGIDVKDLPGQEVASFVHRGPYQWIPCTYEKVLDWRTGMKKPGRPVRSSSLLRNRIPEEPRTTCSRRSRSRSAFAPKGKSWSELRRTSPQGGGMNEQSPA